MKKIHFTLEQLKNYCKNTMVEHLGIDFLELNENCLIAEMPVNEKTIQPSNILHGGANLALAETVGSALSVAVLDPEKYVVKGMEINANHIKSVEKGEKVVATASFLHRGKRSHVVEIRIINTKEQLVCIGRITNFIQHL